MLGRIRLHVPTACKESVTYEESSRQIAFNNKEMVERGKEKKNKNKL